ncbi:MAG: hypothetical protein RSB59_06490, partial [Clostridia bacterium]
SLLHMTIYTQTRKFNNFYKMFFSAKDMLIYRRQDRTSSAYVTIIQTSTKCYRVIYGDCINFYGDYNKSKYKSFRTQWELALWLDELV